MYVSIRVALLGVPVEKGVQLGLGEGPVKSGSNVPTPPVLLVLRHTHGLILAQNASVAIFTVRS